MNFQINEKTKTLKYFLFSQYLADGIRITLEIILPTIICALFGRMELGIIISLGALCVSISDAPGPVKHKRNGMLYCNVFVFLMALLTGFVNDNVLLLGVLILFSSFLFTMFTIYGSRAASIGTAALLVMILRMTKVIEPTQVVLQSIFILSGGIWYMFIAMLFYRLTPYRPAQRSLGDCIHETAKFLRIKSDLYDTQKDHDDEYKKLVVQQVIVNEKQDAVRELLFKNRELLKESTRSGRLLVFTFVSLVDLYEQIMATWYDYGTLHKQFASTGILDEISLLLKDIADELDNIGHAIQANISYKKNFDLIPELEKLKIKIDAINNNNNSKFILKKILVNLRQLGAQVNEIAGYFGNAPSKRKMRSSSEYSKFVSHQKINGTVFINNLTLKSSVFRHALRMMITCGAGYLIGRSLPYGHHSYWILMTIIIILKPGFSLTKKRNFDRFAGTLAGGLIGILILAFIRDRSVLFVLIIFFMLGTYTFQRLNYIVMVIFITPYVLILFNFLGIGFLNVAEERLLDTGIASLLAFIASYFLFPHWESAQLDNYMTGVLKANISYLQKLADILYNKKNSLDYNLTRKNVFVNTANLSAAFHRMLSEPKSKQRNRKEIYEFVVLNHILSSNIAGFISGITASSQLYSKEILQKIKSSISCLETALQNLDKNYQLKETAIAIPEALKNLQQADNQLYEQLDFIYKLSSKINKITLQIFA
jgi:uncharacterized membrane protein (TIGR01666 family)